MSTATTKRPPEPKLLPSEPPPGKLLLTISEVMFLTGYSERQIWAFISEGRLKNCSADRIARIRRGDVLRLIDNKPPR